MTKYTLLTVILAVLPAGAAADEAKADQDAMQGKWVIASFTRDGQQQPKDTYQNLELLIKGDKYIVTQDGEAASRTFKLDPLKNPKAMDVTYDAGPNKGKTNRAIYAIEGDTLKICRQVHPELERPKEFSADAGSARALITWKRVK